MTVHLTETAITKAARETAAIGRQRELTDAGCRGLRLRLSPGGARTWVLGCRDRFGRARRFVVGAHPALGLAEARDAARALREEVRKGADPIAEARRVRAIGAAARAGAGTLAGVVDLYAGLVGAEQKAWAHSRLRIDRVFAALLPRAIAELTVGDLQFAADRYPARPSAAFAVRTLRPVLVWAAKRQYCAKELTALEPPAAMRPRRRVLTRDELAALLPAFEHERSKTHGACLRFILLTAARLGEVTAARWRDIDCRTGVWTIPQTKSDREHVVPLSRQAVALLERLRPTEPRPEALIFASANGTPLGNWDRVGKWFQTVSRTAGWHRHDLRRTAATLMGELGIDPHVVEAALGHVTVYSGLASVYNRARYRPQVAEALQRLADALDGTVAGSASVVPIRAERWVAAS